MTAKRAWLDMEYAPKDGSIITVYDPKPSVEYGPDIHKTLYEISKDMFAATENISVYPNPFGNYLQIESKVLFAKMMLYDVAGKQILSQNFSKIIDTTNLEQGMYFLHLITEENEVVVKKVIKE